jgi:hypothetical protein
VNAAADQAACAWLMLADAYEQLRHDATIASVCVGGLHGLAILVRKGMAAWMHACVAATSSMPAPSIASVDGVCVPAEVQREVVDVLATMALTTALEVRI